jgi:hypothetical protein
MRTKFGPVRSVVLPMAMKDDASLSAVAALGALDVFPPKPEEAMKLKGDTIRMVNTRLSKITENLVFTVTLLWMLEVSVSCPESLCADISTVLLWIQNCGPVACQRPPANDIALGWFTVPRPSNAYASRKVTCCPPSKLPPPI